MLYNEALTHRSAAAQVGYSQERLEHLGDAVLQLCVTDFLFHNFPRYDEGILTRLRTRMINGKTLAQVGRSMGLERGILTQTATLPDRVFEDTLEALVGAVYMDLGLDASKTFVAHVFDSHSDLQEIMEDTNFKDIVKRMTLKRGLQAPVYSVARADGAFRCTLRAGDLEASGHGVSRKDAEMDSAKAMVTMLDANSTIV